MEAALARAEQLKAAAAAAAAEADAAEAILPEAEAELEAEETPDKEDVEVVEAPSRPKGTVWLVAEGESKHPLERAHAEISGGLHAVAHQINLP